MWCGVVWCGVECVRVGTYSFGGGCCCCFFVWGGIGGIKPWCKHPVVVNATTMWATVETNTGCDNYSGWYHGGADRARHGSHARTITDAQTSNDDVLVVVYRRMRSKLSDGGMNLQSNGPLWRPAATGNLARKYALECV